MLGGGVGGDAGGEADAEATAAGEEVPVVLGEGGVGVDPSPSGKWVAAAVGEGRSLAVGPAEGGAVGGVQLGVVVGESDDELPAGVAGCLGYLGKAGGEPLLLLELDVLPPEGCR